MRLSWRDIVMSADYATQNAGEDDPVDVYAHKMLSFAKKQHQDAAEWHARQVAEIEAEMEKIESRFVVSGEEF